MQLLDAILKAKTTVPKEEVQVKPMPQDWKLAIKDLLTFPRDYNKMLMDNANFVHDSKIGNATRLCLKRGTINGFECELIVYETAGKEAKAFYALYNNRENMTYQYKLTEAS